jgi:hypothetical protein
MMRGLGDDSRMGKKGKGARYGPGFCRARKYIFVDLVDCLEDIAKKEGCPYAQHFGEGFHYLHIDRIQIAATTK